MTVAIGVVGPIEYVHRAGCPEDPASYRAYQDGRVWRCRGCHVRAGWHGGHHGAMSRRWER